MPLICSRESPAARIEDTIFIQGASAPGHRRNSKMWNPMALYIPPRSPHFGGLWKAAVKSFKTHLYKTLGITHI